jgi:hypothetical protein
MNICQSKWDAGSGWKVKSGAPVPNAQLVLVFGATDLLKRPELLAEIQQQNPGALMFGCSTAGEISGVEVTDNSLVVTSVHFEHTKIHVARVDLTEADGSRTAGERLARALPGALPGGEKLNHVIVLSDGLKTNGSQLVEAMTKHVPASVVVTGGLAGDGARFAETIVLSEGAARPDTVVAIGFYGDRLSVGYSAFGGWDPFGPERRITKSRGNVLYELDGQSALMLYKKYLGDQAKDLPGSGLLFPLSLRINAADRGLVRTILSVNEAEQSITFAGDMPEGAYARLMKANFDRLIDGAGHAAESSKAGGNGQSPELAVLISCVGRKLLLNQRIEEEVEAVRDALGKETVITGFYSYGEISPFSAGGKCELHNQTMTVIHLSER